MGAAGMRVGELVDHLFRHEYARLVASLTRAIGPAHLQLAEDVVQEAMLRAFRSWPWQGVPDRPRAWLEHVARNLATDALRRGRVARKVEERLRAWAEADHRAAAAPTPDELGDDTLAMMFACCHPALPPPSRVALTLKTLCGFGAAEIAGALLQREPTVQQRLTRAKELLRREAVELAVPPPGELPDRLESVLEVLYLLFNEGYRAHSGDDLVRPDLVREAIRLCEALLGAEPTARPEVHALSALMHLLGARLPARTGEGGELLTIAQQDRSRWDRAWIGRGFARLRASLAGSRRTAWHVEAAIASCHAAAPRYEDTDWETVLLRYDDLLALRDTGIVRLNRAVAVAKVHGPATGLEALRDLEHDPSLRRYMLLPATRAQLRWASGDRDAAAAAYRDALRCPCSEPERRFLQARLEACVTGAPLPPW